MDKTDLWQLIAEETDNFKEKIQHADLQLMLGTKPARSIIEADSERLRQVIHNLLENAVRYTHAGGTINISASCTADQLHIQLEDSAPAVPSTAITRLGERFYRVEGSRNRAHGGSGLGLALCRRILDAHHATIGFSPSSLGGLCVSMHFPLSESKLQSSI